MLTRTALTTALSLSQSPQSGLPGGTVLMLQIYSILGDIYKGRDGAPAMAIFKFFQSIAACIAFLYNGHMPLMWQLLILVGWVVCVCVCLCVCVVCLFVFVCLCICVCPCVVCVPHPAPPCPTLLHAHRSCLALLAPCALCLRSGVSGHSAREHPKVLSTQTNEPFSREHCVPHSYTSAK